ncbi:MAG: AAA family ATPase, partial [Myxococcales bacterium]|nr:AAA family ATPase [Myxococcales bacterium]
VGLAQALLHEPPILILDEPMSGLDPNQATEIRDLIKKIGTERTVILSTHNLDEVQKTCQRVLIIHEGKIVADDTPEGLAESAGGPRYRVTFLESQRLESGGFRDSKKPPDARSAFAGLDGVDTVRELSRKDGEVRVEIAAHKKGDLRAEIFRAAVEAGMVVVGFETKTQNLDQVFRDLTTREAPASRGRPTKRAAKAEEE